MSDLNNDVLTGKKPAGKGKTTVMTLGKKKGKPKPKK